ncbi:Clp protease proteolytic subunit /Translocation-enhancing protein TepA [Methylophilaceae bacterium]
MLAALWLTLHSPTVFAEELNERGIDPITPSPPNSTDRENKESRVVVMGIKGHISKNLLKKIKESISLVENDPLPAGFIIFLDSGGGDGIAAMEIGRLLRKAKAHIFVTGKCASACVFVLASGVVRQFPALSIGIHQGKLTISNNDAKVLKDINPESNPRYQKILEKFETNAKNYFSEMNISPEFFEAMQKIPPKEIHWMDDTELTTMNLKGFDEDYLGLRETALKAKSGKLQIEREDLISRTNEVVSNCMGLKDNHQKFVTCYKNTLFQKYPLY